jgi:aryl-alcohol dehydrogenase-like predicted oxidoreductase
VDQSLERLQTSYIDVLHVHRYDNSVPPEETMRALHDLVSSGKVRYLAASSMWAFEFATLQFVAEKNGWTPFVAMQNHYNLLYREEEREVIKFCNRTGVGLFPVSIGDKGQAHPARMPGLMWIKWSPLAEGHLARPPGLQGLTKRSSRDSRFGNGRSEADQAIIARVQHVAQMRNWTMSQVALAWLNKRVAAPIVGINSIARLEEALAIRGQELSAEQEAYLEAPYEPKRVQGHS